MPLGKTEAKADQTPLPSNTVIWTDRESEPHCQEPNEVKCNVQYSGNAQMSFGTIAVNAAPTPLLSKAALRTASENKPRCPVSNSNHNTNIVPMSFGAIAVKAAPTPLPSNTVLRTNSESKPRCPEQPEAYDFTNI